MFIRTKRKRQGLWSFSQQTASLFHNCFFLLLLLLLLPTVSQGHNVSRPYLSIWNEANSTVEVSWIHSETRELVRVVDILPYEKYTVNTYVNHEFLVVDTAGDNKRHGSDEPGVVGKRHSCRFQVSEQDEQAIVITRKFECNIPDRKMEDILQTREFLADCRADKGVMNHHTEASINGESTINILKTCIENAVATSLENSYDEFSLQSSLRKQVATSAETYTCSDHGLETTHSVSTHVWNEKKSGQEFVVQVKHNRPASQIHVIERFVDPTECRAMQDAASSTLAPAVVFDGNGGAAIDRHRKASQATLWVQEEGPMAHLSRRIYEYANSALVGLNLTLDGQEPFNSIQYFGRGLHDLEPDQYHRHCDGNCNGRPHKRGSRVATMIAYCEVPDIGGLTNFGYAGVHIKPRVGDAVFFSYINPKTRVMDSGFTHHSGCPVYKGNKKIISHWIRLGVDAKSPYNTMDTLGHRLYDLDRRQNPRQLMEEQSNLSLHDFVSKEWVERLKNLERRKNVHSRPFHKDS